MKIIHIFKNVFLKMLNIEFSSIKISDFKRIKKIGFFFKSLFKIPINI